MATVEAKVFAHHYKNDGTYNVKIRVFHKDKFRFIDTEHCVSKNLVKKHPENKTHYQGPYHKQVDKCTT
ncbi:MAG: hypothetical protein EOO20_00940 [Chryseobacterium sp.]|nr:MAG: hypothetical protein EOO20_00940 [Chryseobacterium sp.]